MLTLSERVNFSPHIDSVCIPRENEQHDNQNCVTTGWGKNRFVLKNKSFFKNFLR